jgi:hypothetical protein
MPGCTLSFRLAYGFALSRVEAAGSNMKTGNTWPLAVGIRERLTERSLLSANDFKRSRATGGIALSQENPCHRRADGFEHLGALVQHLHSA